MKRLSLIMSLVMAIVIVTTAYAAKVVVNEKITVNQNTDKITITGGKGKKISSDKFALSKDGWYIIKISYTGEDVSTCQLSLADQKMITAKDTIGGLLTNWIGPSMTEIIRSKGSLKSEDYVIYVDESGGPWTIEILKSPKPTPASAATSFNGTTNKVTPFFKLKKGSAFFTMHQKRKGQFSSRLWIKLYNADNGQLIGELCHNATEAELTAKKDIPADGSYILEVSGETWDVSFKQ